MSGEFLGIDAIAVDHRLVEMMAEAEAEDDIRRGAVNIFALEINDAYSIAYRARYHRLRHGKKWNRK